MLISRALYASDLDHSQGSDSEGLLGTHHPTHPDLQHDGLRPPSHLQTPTLLHLDSKGRQCQQQTLRHDTATLLP